MLPEAEVLWSSLPGYRGLSALVETRAAVARNLLGGGRLAASVCVSQNDRPEFLGMNLNLERLVNRYQKPPECEVSNKMRQYSLK
jgi:hypothetical protein